LVDGSECGPMVLCMQAGGLLASAADE